MKKKTKRDLLEEAIDQVSAAQGTALAFGDWAEAEEFSEEIARLQGELEEGD